VFLYNDEMIEVDDDLLEAPGATQQRFAYHSYERVWRVGESWYRYQAKQPHAVSKVHASTSAGALGPVEKQQWRSVSLVQANAGLLNIFDSNFSLYHM